MLDIVENVLKLDLIYTPKSNSKFAFPLWHEDELIVKKTGISQGKKHSCRGKCSWKVQADDLQPQKIK